MYLHRPPEELIFMTDYEHKSLHNKGKPTWHTGHSPSNKGKHLSEEWRKAISDAHKARNLLRKPSSNRD